MSFEVDILPVGDLSKSGDAIAFRYGDFSSRDGFQVVVLDGGFQASGSDLCEHIRDYYETDRIDLVVASHPDGDHVSGLDVVLTEMKVDRLWMHRPWLREAEMNNYVVTKAAGTLPEPLRKSLEQAYELEEIAISRGIPMQEPFKSLTSDDLVLRVLGPAEDYYAELVPNFSASTAKRLVEKAAAALRAAATRIAETLDADLLVDPHPDAPGARNNSSVVLHADFGEEVVLFTADVGVGGLEQALDYAQSVELRSPSVVQVPHHGSKRNIGPTMLDRIIGSIGGLPIAQSFASVAKEGQPKHPSQRVVNAIVRRNGKFCRTAGVPLCFRSADVPMRFGWVTAPLASFIASYSEEED